MTKQEIAQKIAGIDFVAVQCDDQHAAGEMIYYREKLINDFSQTDAVCLMFDILEAVSFKLISPGTMDSITEFNYIPDYELRNRNPF